MTLEQFWMEVMRRRSVMPSPGAVWPAMVRLFLLMFKSERRSIVPETLKMMVRLAVPMPVRRLPAPESFRLVTK